jgi:hypothetical protein
MHVLGIGHHPKAWNTPKHRLFLFPCRAYMKIQDSRAAKENG